MSLQIVWRLRDQQTLAALALLGVALAGLWWLTLGRQADWVEFDEANRREPPSFQVDINSATWSELAEVPGIGETLARRIVERREQQGPYRAIGQLREVTGIGAKTLQRIMPYLLLGAEPEFAERD